MHTAVKIHPNYERGQTVYVTDASRAVGVVQSLISHDMRGPYVAQIKSEYAKVADAHRRAEADKRRLPLAKARDNALKLDFAGYTPPKPAFTGTRVFSSYDVATLVPYIDWTPFFQTWDMKGRFPAILDSETQGAAARSLYEDAQAMLHQIVAERWFTPRAIVGFWPANAVGDDIRLFTGESRTETLDTFFTLRQQLSRREDKNNLALADFVAPHDSGKGDYIGGFVVTAGMEEDRVAARFERANDDYGSIMVKALADRIAEAFAEHMHERVRREFWAYAPDESADATRACRRTLSRHPSGGGLPRPARSQREGDALQAARRRAAHRRQTHGEFCHVAGRVGVGPLPLASRRALLRRRQGRARPGRGLRCAQGHDRRGGRVLARADPQL